MADAGPHEHLLHELRALKHRALDGGLSLQQAAFACRPASYSGRRWSLGCSAVWVLLAWAFMGVGALLSSMRSATCLLPNNYLLMEMARPLADCGTLCAGVRGPVVLSADEAPDAFPPLAYASRPLVVRGATVNWTAHRVFSFDFFRELYRNVSGAFEAVDADCQFFPFQTDFLSLEQVFRMPQERARLEPGTEAWYVGWSNCHPEVQSVLRQHYKPLQFLPEDSERSAIDWIFIGSGGRGASLHLDYVQRPSWQAQISGRKRWRLIPPPECEDVCERFDVVVEKGDIVFIDTNQWYHDTEVLGDELSITIGSEYD